MATKTVTCTTSSNIAVIKYWGKRDEKLILPINSSFSVCLNNADVGTITSVAVGDFDSDRIFLNGKEEDINAARIQNCLKTIRERTGDKRHVRIVSANNFPTAAGLASSAAGYACLVKALGTALGFEEKYPDELTTVARQGSGSACRSLYGGFVRWNMGKAADGADSTAQQIYEHTHWPELEVVVLVVSDHAKKTSSTLGMGTSVKTSPLLAHRAAVIVEPRLAEMEAAVGKRDFATFGKLTMQDSNQFHATCMDTYPPIYYMNDTSRAVVALIHEFNEKAGEVVAAYTFDAGPNAVCFTTTKYLNDLLSTVMTAFPAPEGQALSDYAKGSQILARSGKASVEEIAAHTPSIKVDFEPMPKGSIKGVLHSVVGEPPRTLPESECLLDPSTGLPKA